MSALRDLVEKATPGPWEATAGRTEHAVGGRRYVTTTDELGDRFTHLVRSEADATLIALAPDLALLCADMGEALNEAADGWPRPNKYDAVLARLTALEERIDPSAGWEPPPEC